MPRSSAGAKCSSAMRSNGGYPSGNVLGANSGFSAVSAVSTRSLSAGDAGPPEDCAAAGAAAQAATAAASLKIADVIDTLLDSGSLDIDQHKGPGRRM